MIQNSSSDLELQSKGLRWLVQVSANGTSCTTISEVLMVYVTLIIREYYEEYQLNGNHLKKSASNILKAMLAE
jgi:hypothetical protein